MQKSIRAGNGDSSGVTHLDCLGTIVSQGYNLVGSTKDCDFTGITGDLINVDPKLFALIGEPAFHPLLAGSPAIDAGNPAGCTDHLGNPLNFDQRGVSRVGRCDMGAYEYDPSNDPIQRFYFPLLAYQFKCVPLSYADDFSNPSSGWPVGSSTTVTYEYTNGEYRILVKSPNYWAAAQPGFAAGDFSASVDVRTMADRHGSFGIIFGLSEDWSEFYTFEITADQNYVVFSYGPGGWNLVTSGTSSFLSPGTAVNHLKVVRDKGVAAIYANGNLLTTSFGNAYSGKRYIGVIATAYDIKNVDVRFDNFAIDIPSCDTGTTNSRTATWANAFRKPHAYSLLVSEEVREPFIRPQARR
jgi:hypothetical protein